MNRCNRNVGNLSLGHSKLKGFLETENKLLPVSSRNFTSHKIRENLESPEIGAQIVHLLFFFLQLQVDPRLSFL